MAGRDVGAFERLMWTTWLTNPAGRFHGGDEPPPSTWAAVVLSGSGAGGRKQGSRGVNLFAAPSGRTWLRRVCFSHGSGKLPRSAEPPRRAGLSRRRAFRHIGGSRSVPQPQTVEGSGHIKVSHLGAIPRSGFMESSQPVVSCREGHRLGREGGGGERTYPEALAQHIALAVLQPSYWPRTCR